MNEIVKHSPSLAKQLPSTLYLVLSSLFFASLFTQNITFFDIDSETQPILCIFFSLLIFIFSNHSYCISKVKFYVLVLIVLIATSFFYYLVFSADRVNYLSYVSYLIGPFVFLLSGKSITVNKFSLAFSKLYTVVTFLFAVGYVFQINFVMDIFSHISSSLFRRQYGSSEESVRGMAFLFGEPSYAAIGLGVMIIFFRLAVFSHIINQRNSNVFIFMLVFCILTTKSIMGFLIILLLFVRISSWRTLLVSIFIVFSLGAALLPVISLYIPRVGEISTAFNSIDFSMDLSDLVIVASYAEPSGSSRIIANLIGFLGMLSSPWVGFGAGGIQEHWLDVVNEYGMSFVYKHWGFAESIKYDTAIKAQTYLFNASFDFGVFFFIAFVAMFVSFIVSYQNKSISMIKAGMVPLLFLLAFFQGQIANVFMWYIMSLVVYQFGEVKAKNDFN